MSARLRFYVLPAITMSLGWGLRGTIGGGPVGAMIPGAMVTLALCHLLGWRDRVAVAAAFGTIGVGLGGQMTYGQTIGFVTHADTVGWGLLGLTTKGAVWGLSGGLLAGLGFTQSLYRRTQVLVGLILMVLGTAAGRALVDAPKLLYFSNRLDRPREEIWFGLTLGAVALLMYLLSLRRERISAAFALAGLIGGGIGFGGGGLFMWLSSLLDAPYGSWPWWKNMEFFFGLLYGLALGVAAYACRERLRSLDSESRATTSNPSGTTFGVECVVGLAVVVGGLWLQFSIPYRGMYTVVGAVLIGLSANSSRLAWQVALSMTTCGFIRDCLYQTVLSDGVELGASGWFLVLLLAVPIVVLVAAIGERPEARWALLGLTVAGTEFGLLKVAPADPARAMHVYVPLVFVVEATMIAAMLVLHDARGGPGDAGPGAAQ